MFVSILFERYNDNISSRKYSFIVSCLTMTKNHSSSRAIFSSLLSHPSPSFLTEKPP